MPPECTPLRRRSQVWFARLFRPCRQVLMVICPRRLEPTHSARVAFPWDRVWTEPAFYGYLHVLPAAKQGAAGIPAPFLNPPMAQCSVEGCCDRQSKSLGYCRAHYQRFKKCRRIHHLDTFCDPHYEQYREALDEAGRASGATS